MKKILLLLLVAQCIGAMEPKRVTEIKEQHKALKPTNQLTYKQMFVTHAGITTCFTPMTSILPFPPSPYELVVHAAVMGGNFAYCKYMNQQSDLQQNQDKNQ